MQSDTPVEAYNEISEVVAQSYSGAQGHLVEEVLNPELSSFPYHAIVGIVLMQCPHVTGVKEQSPIKVSEDMWTKLEVGKELDISRLFYVGVVLYCRAVAPRSNASDIERSYAVGSPT